MINNYYFNPSRKMPKIQSGQGLRWVKKRGLNPHSQVRVIHCRGKKTIMGPGKKKPAPRGQVKEGFRGPGKRELLFLNFFRARALQKPGPGWYTSSELVSNEDSSTVSRAICSPTPDKSCLKNAFLSSLVNAFVLLFYFVTGLLTRHFHLFTA